MNRMTIIIGAGLTLIFGALLCLFHDFIFDDAFIIYRFARHLALGHGIVWNVGDGPVEGFTSLLWVLLNASAMLLEADPVIFSKAVSTLASLAVIWIIVLHARELHWSLAVVFAGALALSPPFAFLTMMGMETSTAALLVLAAALCAVKAAREPSIKYSVLWHAAALAAFVARPDTAAFNLGTFLSLLMMFSWKKDYAGLRRFLAGGVPFLALFIVYTAWRASYFGHIFPNAFYVKMAGGGGVFKSEGAIYFLSFLLSVFLPCLLLCIYLFARQRSRGRLLEILPLLSGCGLFAVYLFTINPIQGFLWRFVYPVFPALLFGLVHYFSGMSVERLFMRRWWAALLVVLFFAFWTLRLVPLALFEKDARRTDDRIIAGKMLSGLSGTMLVSESGALPYYSGWRSCDLLGLTSAEVAHEGLSYEFLQSLDPDLVMMHELSGVYAPDSEAEEKVNRYMVENGFMAVAAVHKSGGQFHFYFVKKTSPLFNDTVRRLLDIDGVRYGSLEELMFEQRIPRIGGSGPTR
jgi:hypothetical protein